LIIVTEEAKALPLRVGQFPSVHASDFTRQQVCGHALVLLGSAPEIVEDGCYIQDLLPDAARLLQMSGRRYW
jgi:hypothetical protein